MGSSTNSYVYKSYFWEKNLP